MRFQRGEKIGSGGFGEVLRCTCVEDGRQLAMKRLTRPDEESRRRFAREVRMQATLRHKNIVRIVASNVEIENPFYVMPLASRCLRQLLQSTHGETLLWIVRDVTKGLQHAHENGVIHRDLKPENILIVKQEKDIAQISDFGLGRLIDRDTISITYTNMAMGSAPYMAPEQFRDAKNADERADIYSLGKILFEVLTGEMPFPVMDLGKLPAKFQYLVRKATATNPDDRFPSVVEFVSSFVLVTDESSSLSSPAKALREEVEKFVKATNPGVMSLDRVIRLLVDNTEDTGVLLEVLPAIPDPLLAAIFRKRSDDLDPVMKRYDDAVSGGLSFEYCDVVANFYEKVFNFTPSRELKELVLRRLPIMGYAHNRWHVRAVFNALIERLDDEGLVLAVKDVFESNPEAALWIEQGLGSTSIAAVLRRVLRSLGKEATVPEIE